MKRTLAVLAVAAFGVTGCKTKVHKEQVRPGVWIVQDAGIAGLHEGYNPEKGIPGTCLSDGRSIVGIRRIRPKSQRPSVVIVCGPPIPKVAK